MSNAGNGPGKAFIKFFTGLTVVLYRVSGGRLMSRMRGAPICLVTVTGHKSGRRRTVALIYTPDGDSVLLVASLGGAPKHPAWYHNLTAHPQIEVQLGGVTRTMIAREASSAERTTLWPNVVANYPSSATSRQKTSRGIPIFVCTPSARIAPKVFGVVGSAGAR